MREVRVSGRVPLLLLEAAHSPRLAPSLRRRRSSIYRTSDVWHYQNDTSSHILAVVRRATVHGAPPPLPCLVVVNGRGPPAAVDGLGVHVDYLLLRPGL